MEGMDGTVERAKVMRMFLCWVAAALKAPGFARLLRPLPFVFSLCGPDSGLLTLPENLGPYKWYTHVIALGSAVLTMQ